MTAATVTGAGGVPLAVSVEGDDAGGTVVLLHGGGQTRQMWGALARRLVSAGRRVVAYDARGHGDSGRAGEGGYAFDLLADDLDAVMANVAGPFVLVGASMGGLAALLWTVRRRARPAAGLVLVDIVPDVAMPGALRIQRFMTGHAGGFASAEEAAAAVADYAPGARTAEPQVIARHLRAGADGRLRWHWDPRVLEGLGSFDAAALRAALARDGAPAVPTLLLRGADSDVVDDAGEAALIAMLPQARAIRVAGVGHLVAGYSSRAYDDAILKEIAARLPGRA